MQLPVAATPKLVQQTLEGTVSARLESMGLRAACAQIIIATGIATRAITAPAAPALLPKIKWTVAATPTLVQKPPQEAASVRQESMG